MKLVNADKMRELEKRADANGNSYAAMMERAGTLTAQAICDRRAVRNHSVLVLVGPGNNGGDGLVCARVLHDRGAQVRLYLWKRELREEDENWRLCQERGIAFTRAEQDANLAQLAQEVGQAALIVDALLGTGVTRPIEGLLKQVLETVKAGLAHIRTRPADLVAPALPQARGAMPFCIAVDLPSGLNPDTGALDPAALDADLTVTFAFPKVGQYRFPGAGAVGELVVADIGILQEWAADVPLDVATGPEICALLPARPRESNKGTFGKVMLACGSLNFTGAPRLAAMAAGRVGAGLVTLATPRTIYPIVASTLNEATFLPLPDADGDWSTTAVAPLVEQAQDYSALLVGCGLGRAFPTDAFVVKLFNLRSADPPHPLPSLVVDADALNALAEIPEWWTRVRTGAPPILTPHPGEMGRLIGAPIAEVQRDRVETARRYAQAWNAVVVLKGAFTVVAAPDGRTVLLPFADPALATAGTGDVLAGAIAGFLAQYRAASAKAGRSDSETARDDAFYAALVGGYIHGLAGQLVARQWGRAGAVAGDLISHLPQAISLVAESMARSR
ncbi:MAG: NAD(P)H-hydrate dehydratase [Anaerolineae bacterium]